MEKLREVSAFFPAYNEEGNIERTVQAAEKVLEEVAEKYEIIVVDDGSSDKTAEIVNRISSGNDRVRLVSHDKNMGYGMAIRTGFKSCKYEWMVFTDSDGQFDFSEFPSFIEEQRKTEADLVVGYYRKRQVPLKRKFNTFVWQLIIRALLGLKVKDIDCGFKFIRKSVIDSMTLTAERGAFISTEFLSKAAHEKYKIVEIPVTHYPRKAGNATGADIKVILNSFKDLYNVKKKFFLFFFVGLTSTFLSLVLFNILFFFGLSFQLSLILSLLSSVTYNFLMNRNLTFSAKTGPIKQQLIRYAVVYLIAHGINFVVSLATVGILGEGALKANIAVLVGIAVSIPFSFMGYLLWAFKNRKHKSLNIQSS